MHSRRNTRVTSTLDHFPVRVRRQDTTIHHVNLMDELKHFLDVQEPVTRKPLVYPPSVQYDRRSLFFKVLKSLETVFQSRTSLMWNSLES